MARHLVSHPSKSLDLSALQLGRFYGSIITSEPTTAPTFPMLLSFILLKITIRFSMNHTDYFKALVSAYAGCKCKELLPDQWREIPFTTPPTVEKPPTVQPQPTDVTQPNLTDWTTTGSAINLLFGVIYSESEQSLVTQHYRLVQMVYFFSTCIFFVEFQGLTITTKKIHFT